MSVFGVRGSLGGSVSFGVGGGRIGLRVGAGVE